MILCIKIYRNWAILISSSTFLRQLSSLIFTNFVKQKNYVLDFNGDHYESKVMYPYKNILIFNIQVKALIERANELKVQFTAESVCSLRAATIFLSLDTLRSFPAVTPDNGCSWITECGKANPKSVSYKHFREVANEVTKVNNNINIQFIYIACCCRPLAWDLRTVSFGGQNKELLLSLELHSFAPSNGWIVEKQLLSANKGLNLKTIIHTKGGFTLIK